MTGLTFDQWLKFFRSPAPSAPSSGASGSGGDKAEKARTQAPVLTPRDTAETRRVEAAKPFLTSSSRSSRKQRRWLPYIANAPSRESAARKIERFWQLYWGELALVERADDVPRP